MHKYNSNQLLNELNIKLLKKLGSFNAEELTLDYDNTIIFNEKHDSKMTYKRQFGYQPGICTINEDQILYIENRNGNSDAKAFQQETLVRLFDLLNKNSIKKIDNFRADAASYQFDIVRLLENNVKNFFIGCRNSYVSKFFNKVTNWVKIKDINGEIMEVGDLIITPFQKQSRDVKIVPKEYRLVVKRKRKPNNQIDIFTNDANEYRAILTNNFDLSNVDIANFYNHRGNMEKQFDIMKNDFGWNLMPFSTLEKNTVFLYFTATCRSLYSKIISFFSKRIKILRPTDRVKKFLFRFIILPAKWIVKARQHQLRIYGDVNFCT